MNELIRFLGTSAFFLWINSVSAQELFSTAWYFEHYQPFAYTFSPVGFAGPGEAWVFDGRPGVFFKITEDEELDKVKIFNQPERIRGISIEKSLTEFDLKDLESTLKRFPNLQFLQFSGTSFFQPSPDQQIPFPDFLKDLTTVTIFSFLGPSEFTEESLVDVLETHKGLEGLFYFGERGKISLKLLSLPNLKALRCGVGSLPETDFPNHINYLELQGTDRSGYTDKPLERAKKFQKISHLKIRYGRITPEFEFTGFKKLKYLDLESLDSLGSIQIFKKLAVLKDLETLKIWYLQGTKLDFAPLAQLSSLRSLFLGRVAIGTNQDPLEAINKLENLEKLTLTEVRTDYENHSLSNLSKLRELVLTSDSIHSLSPKLFENKPLERIILSYNQLTALEGIENCLQLQNLQIQVNEIKSLSFLDKGFPNLRVLDASENQIRDIPDDFSKLKSLSSLNLGLNQITVFPLEISALTEIDTILLNGNPISEFRGEMVENRSLRELIFVGTFFKTLPEDFSKFKNLSYLMLSHGQLSKLPSGFRNLKNLKLSSQKPDSSVVFRLPKDLYLNTNLENLELGFSSQFSLTSLTEFLSNFKPTKPFSLNLVKMGITELPEGDFWQKINWGSIELSSNQLEKLPASWKNLKNFERIQLFGNPLLPGNNKRLFLTSYNQLAVLLYLQGQEIDLAEIPRADILAGISHLITKYRSEVHGDIILKLAKLAEENGVDEKDLTNNSLAIGLALYQRGEYARAIPFLESHLKEFLSQRLRVLNLIYDTLKALEVSYTQEKEYQKLIDLYLIQGKTLGITSGFFYAGLLEKKYGTVNQADVYLNQGLTAHQKRLEALEEKNQLGLGFILEYLEASLVAGNQKTFERISVIASSWTESDENYQTIFRMLTELNQLQKGCSQSQSKPKIVSGWSFSLLELWIDLISENGTLMEKLNEYRSIND